MDFRFSAWTVPGLCAFLSHVRRIFCTEIATTSFLERLIVALNLLHRPKASNRVNNARVSLNLLLYVRRDRN